MKTKTRRRKQERVGEVNVNMHGSEMEIIEYISSKDITVRFNESGYIKDGVIYDNFKSGRVKCPYDKSVYGQGYLGEGKYKVTIDGKYTRQYTTWQWMLGRACNSKLKERYPSYKDCSVSDDWLNFQNFGKWFDENYYEIDGKPAQLDKDILVKGNKVYSADTCMFVPASLNTLFNKLESRRGDLPIGVGACEGSKKYQVRCSIGTEGNSDRAYLGVFNTVEEAFAVYKNYKENYIKKVAKTWFDKGAINKKLYTAMYNYEVLITD